MSDLQQSLLPAFERLAQLQQQPIDRLALQESFDIALSESTKPQVQLRVVAAHLHLSAPQWLKEPDASQTPCLLFAARGSYFGRWGVLRGLNSQGQWVCDWWNLELQSWEQTAHDGCEDFDVACMKLARPFFVSNSQLFRFIRDEFLSHKAVLRDVALGTAMINLIALAISFYSMQIYDRVVPTGASQTLFVLTLGVLLAITFEYVSKHIRSHLYESLIDKMDQRLSRAVYTKFLSIRLDQLPQSVGALASQLRGYESVRGFLTVLTTQMVIDAPFAVIFMAVIASIGGVLVFIPLVFLVLSCGIGLLHRAKVENYAHRNNTANNVKTGLLVETVEGAETIKSGQGGWRMLARWMRATDDAREADLAIRRISESSQHLTASLQQVSYVLLVATGALMVSKGELSMGGLMACSILSGRVLSPIAMISNQLVQWSHTKAAVKGLDRLWSLEEDHHSQERPILLEELKGDFKFESVKANYGPNAALSVPKLNIRPGEKVGVIGPVGAGKTTLLRLMSGMYKPQEGRVLLDDVDLSHVSKPVLADQLGYVQQDGRLFSGTLRENLILGQIDPGDEKILEAARLTGLMESVIATHPKGLQREIYEGGTGLSGGQRQLVNLTRAFLRKPKVWLLDEPTASMDRQLEMQVKKALSDSLTDQHTLILVTHKTDMLELVQRLIIVSNHQVILDGPRDQVLMRLQTLQMDRAA